MKNFFKSKIATVAVIVATVILAGIAVFTAIRLYQLRQQAVAPTAPTSKPEAAETKPCTALTFNLGISTPTPTPTPTATPKPGDCATNFKLTKTANPARVNPGSETTFTVVIERTSSTPDSLTISKIEDSLIGTYVGGSTTGGIGEPTIKKIDSLTTSLVWNINKTFSSGNKFTFTFKAKARTDAFPEEHDDTDIILITQLGTGGNFDSSCASQASLIVNGVTTPTATPTPTGTAAATATPTATATLIAQASPTAEPSLPAAGISWPTIVVAGFGILILLGSLLLAL